MLVQCIVVLNWLAIHAQIIAKNYHNKASTSSLDIPIIFQQVILI